MEAVLRLNGHLRNGESLSIQELVNVVTELQPSNPEKDILTNQGAIWDIRFALDALVDRGIVLDHDGPVLTWSLGKKFFYDGEVIRYSLRGYHVYYHDNYMFVHQDIVQGTTFLEERTMHLLRVSPLSVVVRM